MNEFSSLRFSKGYQDDISLFLLVGWPLFPEVHDRTTLGSSVLTETRGRLEFATPTRLTVFTISLNEPPETFGTHGLPKRFILSLLHQPFYCLSQDDIIVTISCVP